MFVEVVKEVRKSGLEVMEWAINLEIDGVLTPVPIRELENFELDSDYDDMSTATQIWFDYKNKSYEVGMPKANTPDWYIVQEILNPE